jgi:inner membrane protein
MDNVCHTLVGLALAESGLARRTARGTVTLAIAANLPDVDALLYVAGGGAAALAGRRGLTHGVLAMLLLPLVLALAVWWWDRVAWLGARRRDPIAATNAGPSADVGALFVLATVGVLSHALLDWMNSYGVRLLMPFGHEWFYGDALFIVDPWLLVALAAGVVLSARRRRRGGRVSLPTGKRVGPSAAAARGGRPDLAYAARPARVALAAAALYVGAMLASSAAGTA